MDLLSSLHRSHAPHLLTTIVSGLLVFQPAAAQGPSAHRTALWASAGAGLTSPYAFGIVATGAFRYDRLVFRARYASTGEFAGDWFEDLGVLVGVRVTPPVRRAQLTVGAGVGRVRWRHYGALAAEPDPPPGTGFLVDAEGRVALTRFVGVTTYLFGDLNARLTFGGVALGLYLGSL